MFHKKLKDDIEELQQRFDKEHEQQMTRHYELLGKHNRLLEALGLAERVTHKVEATRNYYVCGKSKGGETVAEVGMGALDRTYRSG